MILVAGESLVDVVVRAGEQQAMPGGSPANVAVALARLGNEVRLLTAIGDDEHGDIVERHLRESGVELAVDPRILARTSTAVATLDGSGAASYRFDIGGELPEPDPGLDPMHLHIGSLGALMPPGAHVVSSLVDRLRAGTTVSYDINARPSAMSLDADALARIEQLAARSDLVKASDEDLHAWRPDSSLDDSVQRLLELGATAVVVTQGREGARCSTRSGTILVPAEDVVVADTIGAGDSFGAAVVDGLGRLGALGPAGRARLASLSLDDWAGVVRRAHRAAAITVSRPGADPPRAAELEQ